MRKLLGSGFSSRRAVLGAFAVLLLLVLGVLAVSRYGDWVMGIFIVIWVGLLLGVVLYFLLRRNGEAVLPRVTREDDSPAEDV